MMKFSDLRWEYCSSFHPHDSRFFTGSELIEMLNSYRGDWLPKGASYG